MIRRRKKLFYNYFLDQNFGIQTCPRHLLLQFKTPWHVTIYMPHQLNKKNHFNYLKKLKTV